MVCRGENGEVVTKIGSEQKTATRTNETAEMDKEKFIKLLNNRPWLKYYMPYVNFGIIGLKGGSEDSNSNETTRSRLKDAYNLARSSTNPDTKINFKIFNASAIKYCVSFYAPLLLLSIISNVKVTLEFYQ